MHAFQLNAELQVVSNLISSALTSTHWLSTYLPRN